MKPYPDYKPTGLAWLPEIPKHWKSAKIRELFTERIQKASDKEFAPLSVSKGGIVPQIATVAKTDNGDNRKRVKVGDFVINSRSDRKGSSGISAYDGSVSLINIVLNPRAKENGRFLHYLLKSIPFTEEYYRNGRGIVADLWTPPADEQAQIVRYLDAMTAKINKLIRAKKTVNELIMEQLIEKANRCVNDKKLKRYRLKNILTLVSDEIDRKDDILYSPVGVLNRGRGVFHKPELLGKELGDSTFFHVYPGDMIFSGQFAWEGAVGILQDSEKRCIASHRYPLARAVDPDVLKLEYLWAFFQTKYGDMILNTHSYGAAGRNRPLNIQRLLAEDIPLPSIAEQNDFVILFRQLQKAKLLATKYTKQLQDYKDALIAAVVTGKVDVRKIAVEAVSPEDLAPSDDPDESEELDSPVSEESEE